MKVKAIITLYANGKEIAPGTIVDIADGEAQRLIERGFAAENKTERASPSKAQKPLVEKGDLSPKSEADRDQAPGNPALEDIIEAIAELDKTRDFGKGGKPTSQDLEAILKASITDAQLDRAFEVFLAGKEEDSYPE